jgi:hypothetical protein
MGTAAGSARAQSPTPTEQFVLTGVVFVEGGRGGVAWLQEPTFTNNLVVAVRVGDNVGPYRLTKIGEFQIELEGPSGTVAIPLAGLPGTMTAAVRSEAAKQPDDGPARSPFANNPDAVVIPRGDPRRNFPASSLLIGAGAKLTGKPSVAVQPQAGAASGPPLWDNPVPAAMRNPAPEPPGPPSPALNNPDAIVIPRGDPRRNFPASTLLMGSGARLTGPTGAQ